MLPCLALEIFFLKRGGGVLGLSTGFTLLINYFTIELSPKPWIPGLG